MWCTIVLITFCWKEGTDNKRTRYGSVNRCCIHDWKKGLLVIGGIWYFLWVCQILSLSFFSLTLVEFLNFCGRYMWGWLVNAVRLFQLYQLAVAWRVWCVCVCVCEHVCMCVLTCMRMCAMYMYMWVVGWVEIISKRQGVAMRSDNVLVRLVWNSPGRQL